MARSPGRLRWRWRLLTGALAAVALAAAGWVGAGAGGPEGSVLRRTTASAPTPGPDSPLARAGSAVPRAANPFQVASGPAPAPTLRPPTLPQLPRGGRTLFPRYRLVGYAGAPDSPALGRLGIGNLDARAREIDGIAAPYARGRQILPVLELIAVVAQPYPGRDGMYRVRQPGAVVDRYLAAARKVRGLLLLNIQPGRADFLPEVAAFDRWLREPDVGLALDPEWAVRPGDVPGRSYGTMSGAELDAVSRHVSAIVTRYRLPEKALVFHQVAASVVTRLSALRAHPGVVPIKSVDGIGPPREKVGTWTRLVRALPPTVTTGFKLFYDEDRRSGPLMTPAQVLALRPEPQYVLYE